MSLISQFLIVSLFLTCSFSAGAQETTHLEMDPGHHTLKKIRIREVKRNGQAEKFENIYEREFLQGAPNFKGQIERTQKMGKIISVGRDLVALGEDTYRLVTKGKPSNTTSYAPISVIPKVNGQPVDILSTESWTIPEKRTYQVSLENLYGVEVVHFRYSIFYSYNGSYDGVGSYLTAVQVVPEHVKTLFGWDFTATMKLGGILNQGTRAAPIAGATLLLEYTINSGLVALNNTATYFVNGKGAFKSY